MKLVQPSGFVALLALLGSATLSGQTAPTPAASDETVVLNPFVVTTQTQEGYLSSSASAAGRVVQRLEDIPQEVAIFNAQFLQDIQPTSFQDALRYDSSTNFNNSQFNGAAGLVRGFVAPNPLRNGVGNLATSQGNPLGTEAIEQVEIVKGAAAVLYGPGQPGGVINYVTKSPLFHEQNTADLTFFGAGGYKASLDSTGPIPLKSADGRDVLAYRVVAAHEGRDLYQINNQQEQRDVLYGAVTYRPLAALTIDAQWESDRQKTSFFNSDTSTQAVTNGLANGTILPAQTPLPYDVFPGGAKWTYQDTYGYAEQHDKYAQLSAVLNRDFGRWGDWTLRALYSWSESALFRVLDDIGAGNLPQPVTAANIGQTVNFTQTVTAADVAAGRLWIPARYVRQIDGFPTDNLDTQWDLTGKFTTGPLKHTFLAGTDGALGSDVKSGIAGVSSIEKQAYVGAAGAVNAIWVDSPDLRPISNINWNDIRDPVANPNGIVTAGNITTSTGKHPNQNNNLRLGVPWLTVPPGGNYDNNYYFFDGISLLNDRLQVSLGARYDKVGVSPAPGQEFTNSQWTYRYGFVFKLLPTLHVFALHNESFNPNPTAADQAFGRFIAPQQGTQNEVGLRLPLLQNRLMLEGSVYKISTTNVVQNNPFGNVGVVPPIPSNLFAFVPGITNKGFDLDAKINVTSNSQLIASYSHYDINNAAGPAQLATGISEFPVNNVPNDQFAVWAKYGFAVDPVRGLSLSLGDRWVGQRPGGSAGALPALYLNSYSVVDAGIGYAKGRWSANLLVRNVFNTFAFRLASASNRLYPEDPRTSELSLGLKF